MYVTFKKLKMKGGPFAVTCMRFPGIPLFEQIEQKFRRIRKKNERL